MPSDPSDIGTPPLTPGSAPTRLGLVLHALSLGMLAFLGTANGYTLWLARSTSPGHSILPEAVTYYYGCQPGAAVAGAPLICETLVLVGAMVGLFTLRSRAWAGYVGVVTVFTLGAAFFRALQF